MGPSDINALLPCLFLCLGVSSTNLLPLNGPRVELACTHSSYIMKVEPTRLKQPNRSTFYTTLHGLGTVGRMPCTHLPDWPLGTSVSLQTFLLLT